MMTGLVLAEGSPEEVAVTLAALVPAVVEGLLGDAVVIARQPDPALATIAEIAGASLAFAPGNADPWRAGGTLARREWLLCLKSGDVPGEGWMRAVDRFIASGRSRGSAAGPLLPDGTWRGRRVVAPGRGNGGDPNGSPGRSRSAQLAGVTRWGAGAAAPHSREDRAQLCAVSVSRAACRVSGARRAAA
jgi:hypothetical protein